jgi:hypothetical protein
MVFVESGTHAWDMAFYAIPFHAGHRVITRAGRVLSRVLADEGARGDPDRFRSAALAQLHPGPTGSRQNRDFSADATGRTCPIAAIARIQRGGFRALADTRVDDEVMPGGPSVSAPRGSRLSDYHPR